MMGKRPTQAELDADNERILDLIDRAARDAPYWGPGEAPPRRWHERLLDALKIV